MKDKPHFIGFDMFREIDFISSKIIFRIEKIAKLKKPYKMHNLVDTKTSYNKIYFENSSGVIREVQGKSIG